MRYLICLSTVHRFGCARIAERHREALRARGHEVEICHMPGDRAREVFHDVPLSKKSYDVIVAVEYFPSRRWCESGHVVWLPMGELAHEHHLRAAWSWLRIVWHNRDAYEVALKKCPWAQHHFLQFGITRPFDAVAQRGGETLRVLLQERLRSLESVRWAQALAASGCAVTIQDEHARVGLQAAQVASTYVSGMVDRATQFNIFCEHDVYVCPRVQEGAGLLLHEAAWAGCAVVGADHATLSHTLPSQVAAGVLPAELDAGETERRGVAIGFYRYAWSAPDDCALLVAGRSPSEWRDIGRAAQHDAQRCLDEFEAGYAAAMIDGIEPRQRTLTRNWRAQGLVVNCWRGGGQGVAELAIQRQLERLGGFSWVSAAAYASWTTKEPSWFGQELANGRTRSIAVDRVVDVQADVAIIHWSSALEKQAHATHDPLLLEQWNAIDRWMKSDAAYPRIVWIHEVAPDDWPRDWRPDALVFPSDHARRRFADIVHVDAKRNYVIPHFVDERLKIGCDISAQPTALVLGRLVQGKVDVRYLAVAHAVLAAAGWKLLLCGEADPAITETLRQNGVQFEHVVAYDADEKSRVLSQARLLLHFSGVYESFCLSALEALAFSCPVITNRPELGSFGGGVVVVSGTDEAYRVLDRLVNDPVALANRSESAAINAKSFSAERWAHEFNAVLDDCLRRRRSLAVVITATNEERLLVDAFGSCDRQGADEIVIVANAPDEETREVIRTLQLVGGCRVYDIPERVPQSGVFARLADVTACDIVLLLDGDDALLPGAVDAVRLAFARTGDPVSLVWGDCVCVDADSGEEYDGQLTCPAPRGEMLSLMLAGKNVIGHPIACARWALQLIEPDQSLTASADKDLALRLEEVGDTVYVPQRLYRYTANRPGSVTRERREEQLASRERVLRDAAQRRRKTAELAP